MKIESLKDLSKLIALCRKTGVQSIRVDNIEMHLGADPTPKRAAPKKQAQAPTMRSTVVTDGDKIDPIETDELTPEQLLMWSVQPAEQN